MHIILIISSLGPGGAERVLCELANYLSSKHYTVSLITLDAPTVTPFYYLDTQINLIQLNKLEVAPTLYSRLKNILQRLLVLRKTVNILKPDCIISFIDIMNITVLLASMGKKIPVIVAERTDPNFHALPIFYKWLRIRTYPFAATIIVQTNNAATFFPNNLYKKIHIIPNPVKKPRLQKEVTNKPISKIVSVGRLVASKDHALLISAFADLCSNNPAVPLSLIIYGEGEERCHLETLIASLNLQNKVFLPGTVQDIQRALYDSDCFIFPSHYEGFPNALCEAMAMGLPVIASNCSGNCDVVRNGIDGMLFPVGDKINLTKVIEALLLNPEKGSLLSLHAKEVYERFNDKEIFLIWENTIKKIVLNS